MQAGDIADIVGDDAACILYQNVDVHRSWLRQRHRPVFFHCSHPLSRYLRKIGAGSNKREGPFRYRYGYGALAVAFLLFQPMLFSVSTDGR